MRTPKSMRVGAILIAPLAAFVLQIGCSPDATDLPTSPVEEPAHDDLVRLNSESMERAGIQIEQSRKMKLQAFVTTTGVVSQNETRIAHLRPLSRGVIEKVYVRRGDRVRSGEPLILYDNIELGELIGDYLSHQAHLEKDRAQLEVALKFWERAVQLLEVQAIAKKEVELRAAELKNAEAMVRSRRADIARTEEKLHRFGLTDDDLRELDSADSIHRTKSHNTLKAPFSGVIIGYDVAEGELVAPDRQLLTLADMSILWVLADVYEKDLGQVSEGKQVEVQSPAYPNRVFRGRLTYISDVLDSATRTAKVRCVVPNRDRALKLEMFVTVKIPSNRESFSVAVPESAIQNIDGQDAVFAQQREGVFRKQTVQTGLRYDGWIAVTGLPEGTPVVSTGSFYLKSILKREAIGEEH